MDASQRQPYEKRCTQGSASIDKSDKLTSHGIPFEVIDKLKREEENKESYMKKRISDLVNNQSLPDLAKHQFYFTMVNYFCKTNQKQYVPAELAIVKFSFKHGILKKYNQVLDPG